VVLARRGYKGHRSAKILKSLGAPRGSLITIFRAVRTKWCLKR